MTLPLIFALNHASSSDKRSLIKIVKNKKEDPQSILWLMDKVRELGGISYAQKRLTEWQEKAKGHLTTFPEGPSRTALQELVDYIGNRVR